MTETPEKPGERLGRPSIVEAHPRGAVIHLVVQPGAAKTEVIGPHGDPPRLKIRVAAPPIDGRANEEVLCFLMQLLGVRRTALALLRGEKGRRKDVLCLGMTSEALMARVSASKKEDSAPR